MRIDQIEQLLGEIEDNARKKIVKIGDVYILRDDEPKYRALLALKDFLGRNADVIRELNTLAKAAGVATAEIMSTYGTPEIVHADNIQVGLGDPKIEVPMSNARTDAADKVIESAEDLKKKSGDLASGGSGAVVAEPVEEEVIPDMPPKAIVLNYNLNRDGIPDGVTPLGESRPEETPLKSSVMPAGGIEPMVEEPLPFFRGPSGEHPVPTPMTEEQIRSAVEKIESEPLLGDTGFVPFSTEEPVPEPESHFDARAMTDEEIQAAMVNIGSMPAPSNVPPIETEPTQEATPEEVQESASAELTEDNKKKHRKVTSRRLHNWGNVSLRLSIMGVAIFGENVTNSTSSYRIINLKIGTLRSALISGVGVADSQVEELHNEIVAASDLTASEKRKLYKKLGRLDKAIERYNKRESGNSGRRRGR